MSGLAVVVSGPSGVGKDTVIDAWIAADPMVERVVSACTRKPREGERDGVAYHFMSQPDFESRASRGEFLEHKKVHGNWYATPKSSVEKIVSSGKVAVLKIDVQGALALMDQGAVDSSVFILPPNLEVLEQRLNGREDMTVSRDQISERLRNALFEIALSYKYQHQIINDSVEECVARLRRLFPG